MLSWGAQTNALQVGVSCTSLSLKFSFAPNSSALLSSLCFPLLYSHFFSFFLLSSPTPTAFRHTIWPTTHSFPIVCCLALLSLIVRHIKQQSLRRSQDGHSSDLQTIIGFVLPITVSYHAVIRYMRASLGCRGWAPSSAEGMSKGWACYAHTTR